MNVLFAMWTPGPVELIIIIFALTAFIAGIVLTRWIFRVNKQISLLSQIRDELKKLNSNKEREVEK